MINIPLHSILMLVGPSYCGKSTFANNIKSQLKQQYHGIKVSIISSDDLRRELLDDDSICKYDKKMQEVSKEAFELLFTKLKLMTTYPVNNHVVIVDTTGLSKEFRDDVRQISYDNQYTLIPVLFDFKNQSEYLKGVPSDYNKKKTVFNHIERFRKEAKTSIRKRDFKQVIQINKKYDPTVSISNWNEYQLTQLSEDFKYDIISDSHGCLDEVKDLIQKLGYSINNNIISGHSLHDFELDKFNDSKIVFAGDLVNKGNKSKELMQFILKNKDKIILVEGNHERFNFNYFFGEKRDFPADVRKRLFKDTFHYENDQEYKDLLKGVIDISLPFVETKSFILTHAPCLNKFLGKIDSKSKLNQQKTNTPKKKEFDTKDKFLEAKSEYYSFIKEQANKNHKFHISGHTTIPQQFRFKNKILIDTGCVFGGVLTSVNINNRNKIIYTTVKSQKENKETIDDLFVQKESEYKIEDFKLNKKDTMRLNSLIENKVNFISGTVSPSPSNIKNNDLESLSDCLLYYKKSNISEVVLQPKYMGSRCNLYLFEDISKCYAVSRNGFIIEKDLDLIYSHFIEKFKNKWDQTSLIILDGELLPWSAIGKGLIEDHFETISIGLERENQLIDNLSFVKELDRLKESRKNTDFEKERIKTPKKELSKKYGNTTYESFINLDFFKEYNHDEEVINANIYKDQLNIFASEQDLEFKAFMILKEVKKDGEEIIMDSMDNYDVFCNINDDKCLLIDLNDPEYLKKATDFYNLLTETYKLEGIMVKPRKFVKNIAPMMKVRNKSYLTLIYGHNYLSPEKYKIFVKEKRVKRKIRSSIKEFNLGLDLLKVPYNNLNKHNKRYEGLIANFIGEEKVSKELDPKL